MATQAAGSSGSGNRAIIAVAGVVMQVALGAVYAWSVFRDPLSVTIGDPRHSIGEERLVTFGMSSRERVPAVMHAERAERIRIISARRASRKERAAYAAAARPPVPALLAHPPVSALESSRRNPDLYAFL
jgi:uncharacterized protein